MMKRYEPGAERAVPGDSLTERAGHEWHAVVRDPDDRRLVRVVTIRLPRWRALELAKEMADELNRKERRTA